jgi:hypothetical protein
MPRRVWKSTEIAWLRENYLTLGAKACAEHFGNATAEAVIKTARRYGIAQRAADIQEPSSEWADAVIRRAHESGSQNPWTDAARTLGRTRSWVRRRANKLGLRARSVERRPWSAAEEAFVTQRLHWPAHRLASAMQENGWPRTQFAVEHHLKRRGLSGTDTSYMSGLGVAAALGVSLTTIRRWIHTGLLIAEPRDPDSASAAQTGSGRAVCIAEEDLAAFILLNPEKVTFTKIEVAQTKTWFLDLISRYPKPPSRSDLYQQRQIESLHTFEPDFDVERIAAVLNTEESTVRSALGEQRRRDRARARERAIRAAGREVA